MQETGSGKSAPVDPLIGSIIDRYLITERLQEGAGGTLYLAVHPALGKRAAIKIMRGEPVEQERLAERFFAEGRAAAQIDHANVVSVFNFGRLSDGRLYLVMEHLPGETLEEFLRREGPLEFPVIRSIGGQLLAALAACHERGIIHRDIKPENLLLIDRPGGYKQLKLIDFGVAQGADCGPEPSTDDAGALVGTPLYMAPEQTGIDGEMGADARTDLYSFGVILYRMATGRLPFVAQDWQRILYKQAREAPVPPRSLRPQVAPELEALILRCLAKRPEERPQSATEALRALQAISGGEASVESPGRGGGALWFAAGAALGALLTWLGSLW